MLALSVIARARTGFRNPEYKINSNYPAAQLQTALSIEPELETIYRKYFSRELRYKLIESINSLSHDTSGLVETGNTRHTDFEGVFAQAGLV